MSDTYYEEKELQNLSSVANRSVSRNVSNLEHWLSRLFLVLVALTVVNTFSGDGMADFFPGLHTFCILAGVIFAVLYAVILLKLSSEEALYRKSAYYWFGSSVLIILGTAVMYVGGSVSNLGLLLGAIIMVASTVFSLIGEYYEYYAHANVLQEFDADFSAKWIKLWKVYLGMTIGTVLATPVMSLIPLLGTIAVVFFSVGLLVISVLKILYLYKMVELFRA